MDTESQIKTAIGGLLLRAESNVLVKRVLTAFDPFAKRTVNYKQLNQLNLDMLEPCAEFLSINLADVEENKLYTKESLVYRIMYGISSLLPTTCGDCNELYVVELDAEEPPLFYCYTCFRGSHNCDFIKTFHKCMSEANIVSLLSGHVWMCRDCKASHNPVKPRKSKSRHSSITKPDPTLSRIMSNLKSQNSSPTQQSPNQSVVEPESEEISQTKQIDQSNSLDKDFQSELQDKLGILAKDQNVCLQYKKGKCPHGLKGNKLVDGKQCEFMHPRYCPRFCSFGNQNKGGCKKGARCQLVHPVLCKYSVKKKLCTNLECTFIHLKGTRRKEARSTNAKEKRPSPEHSVSNDSKDHFLELRGLVETMQSNFLREIADIRSGLVNTLYQQQQMQQMSRYALPPPTGAALNQYHHMHQPQFQQAYLLSQRPPNMPPTMPFIPPASS